MSTLRGVVAALALAMTMTGCVSLPAQQSYNLAANIHVKRIEMLPTHPTRTSVVMLNHPGTSFGLIGGLVAVADQASKQKRLDAITTANAFEPLAYFKEQLTMQLNTTGHQSGRGPLGLHKSRHNYESAPNSGTCYHSTCRAGHAERLRIGRLPSHAARCHRHDLPSRVAATAAEIMSSNHPPMHLPRYRTIWNSPMWRDVYCAMESRRPSQCMTWANCIHHRKP